MSEEFPYTTPAGSDARMFIQWKGTKVCLDFYCPCGARGHLDGDFAYHVQCPACGQVYEMGTQVIARKVDGDDHPATQVLDVDDMPVVVDTTVYPDRSDMNTPNWRHCRELEFHPALPVAGSEVPRVRATGRPGAVCATCGEALTTVTAAIAADPADTGR